MNDDYVIGVDFGTESVRAVIVNARSGHEVSSSIFYYTYWMDGHYCNPSSNRFRQHPLDYIEGLDHTIKDCIRQSGDTNGKKSVRFQ